MAGGFETVAARPPQRPPAPPRQQTASLRGAFPSLRFQTLNSRSREAWSRHPLAGARCSTTGELDHRRAGARPVTRASAVLSASLRFSKPLNSAAARRGLDTRSLALAARPPESSTTAELAPGQSPEPPRCCPRLCAFQNP